VAQRITLFLSKVEQVTQEELKLEFPERCRIDRGTYKFGGHSDWEVIMNIVLDYNDYNDVVHSSAIMQFVQGQNPLFFPAGHGLINEITLKNTL
jgi:hypothetical protein